MIDLKAIRSDGDWTLFLDRDGVINERLPGVYIGDIRDFKFIQGVPDALAKASRIFRYIFIVTNQQGIGKGLMSASDLENVHGYMLDLISKAGGRIDALYYCPAVEAEQHPDRKPATGMALKAKQDFSDLEFSHAVMVGDSPSDILFGQRLGMKTVFAGPKGSADTMEVLPDLCCDSLTDFISAFYLPIS
jgi:histidinol-phosphate phosphatase family protein